MNAAETKLFALTLMAYTPEAFMYLLMKFGATLD